MTSTIMVGLKQEAVPSYWRIVSIHFLSAVITNALLPRFARLPHLQDGLSQHMRNALRPTTLTDRC